MKCPIVQMKLNKIPTVHLEKHSVEVLTHISNDVLNHDVDKIMLRGAYELNPTKIEKI